LLDYVQILRFLKTEFFFRGRIFRGRIFRGRIFFGQDGGVGDPIPSSVQILRFLKTEFVSDFRDPIQP
jgi:hypothetical protein